MVRILVYALAILHLGPGLAFAVLAFGCGTPPWLGNLCGKSEIQSFLTITVVLWLLMSLFAVIKLRSRVRSGAKP